MKGNHNTKKIHFGNSLFITIFIGSSRNSVGGTERVKPASSDKEFLISEYERKKEFIGKIKGLIHTTNFSVGSNEPSFDRKETATVDNPHYEQVIVSPKPHKNNSTLKIKY